MIQIQEFFDKATFTLTYVVWDPESRDCLLIDPVLDYDCASSTLTDQSLLTLISFLKKQTLTPQFVLETHAHADHVSGAQRLKHFFPRMQVAIGSQIIQVQKLFKNVFDLPSLPVDGSQFDRLLIEGETLKVGTLAIEVLYTPGHTPACASYRMADAVFTGDALFMPDSGTGRCDFPGGSAQELCHSITQKLYALPDHTRVYTGHDYQPNGRALQFQSTISEEKLKNIHIKASTTQEEFVSFRTQRDATLAVPKLLFPSVQLNIDGGRLPEPHSNRQRYLQIPLTVKYGV